MHDSIDVLTVFKRKAKAMQKTLFGTVTFVTVLLYLISLFYNSIILTSIYSGLASLLLLAALVKTNRANRIVLTLLLLGGGVLFFYYRVDVNTVLHSFGTNLNLIALFVFVPLFGTFLSKAGYLESLQQFIQKREKEKGGHPYRLSFILTASIGSLLNLGSMPLVHKIGSESFTSFYNKRFSMMIFRTFGFCMLWSPYFVNVGLVLTLYDLSWQQIGIYGLGAAILYALAIWIYFPKAVFKNDEKIVNETTKQVENEAVTLRPFVLYVAILVILSVILEWLLPFSMLTIVSILAIIYPFVWAFIIRIGDAYFQEVKEYATNSFTLLFNEIGIFVTAGFFGEALAQSGFGASLSEAVISFSQGIILLLIISLFVMMISLAFIGIHPVIIVSVFGTSFVPESIGVTPEFMAIFLLCGWVLSTQSTPFSGSVLMGSHLMKESPWKVSRKNIPFVIGVFILFTAYLMVIHTWLL